jgi:hypothetical protein
MKWDGGGKLRGRDCRKKEGPRLGIQGPKGRAPVIRPRRDRIMGSSIQLPSQRQVGTTHTSIHFQKMQTVCKNSECIGFLQLQILLSGL